MAVAIAPAAAQVPTARPRASPSNELPRMPRLFGISIAAPIPWMPRAASSTSSPGASAQPIEAAANSNVPIVSIRRRPK